MLEERGEWARVETAYAYPGWIRREALGGDADPEWLAARGADPVAYARSLLGTRYEWGGMTAAGIDCSGLVHMSFRATGTLVPRDADEQEAAGEKLGEDELRAGDLITYGPPESADHIAFWLGGGRILHSTRREGVDGVVEEDEPAELRARRRALVRFGAFVAALSFFALVGCGSQESAAPPGTTHATTVTVAAPKPAKPTGAPHAFPDFRIAMDESTDYLDPGLSDSTEGWGVMWNVYLPLLGYKHDSGLDGAKLVPYLARALPTVSPDKRTYTLTLRKDLHYSNGTRVKAGDFKAAIERDFILDSAGAGLFRDIIGAKGFAQRQKGGIPGIVVNDRKRTIVIHLRAPEGDFENILASEFAAPVPASAPRADTSLHPLPATGPYVIQSYQPRARIVEVRNPYFHAWQFHGAVPAGNPDRVTWDVVPNAGVALRRVIQGKDDWMSYWPVPSKRLASIQRKYPKRLEKFTTPNLLYFFMNTRVAPFDKLAVRRAVNYAISRRTLVELAGGLAKPTENVLPPDYPSFRRHHLYRHDLRLARKLVRESGERGKRVVVWNHDVAADLPFTEYLASVLRKLGFKVRERVLTASDYWATLGEGTTRAQIGFADWFQDYPHPLDWFGVLLNGQQIRPTHNDDYAYFDSPSVNRKIDALTRQPKLTSKVDARWAQLDLQVMRLAPWAPFLNRKETDFFSARVDLGCYVNNVLYEFDYATICVRPARSS